ncbi:hypothetical protein J6590_104946, partial [Homalodisca vitripennis]
MEKKKSKDERNYRLRLVPNFAKSAAFKEENYSKYRSSIEMKLLQARKVCRNIVTFRTAIMFRGMNVVPHF